MNKTSHPRQSLHWQHRNLYGLDIQHIIFLAEETARNGLNSKQKAILNLASEKRGCTPGVVAREILKARDFRDPRVRDAREMLEVLAVLSFLKRHRSKKKRSVEGYTTPQAITYYTVHPEASWDDE